MIAARTAQVRMDEDNNPIGRTGPRRFTAVYRARLVAPVALRVRFRSLVEREMAHARAGRRAGIVIKNNSISDPEIIRLLYRASCEGVRIDAIVRGICCLRPGLPGVSDLITVRSVVGKFLEHSRIYAFENGGSGEIYIGSADLMERNLDRRVEALCPVLDPAIRDYIARLLRPCHEFARKAGQLPYWQHAKTRDEAAQNRGYGAIRVPRAATHD